MVSEVEEEAGKEPEVVEPYYPPVEGEDSELSEEELDEAQEQADATEEAEEG